MRRARRTPVLQIASPLSHWVAALEAEQRIENLTADIKRSGFIIEQQKAIQMSISQESLNNPEVRTLCQIAANMAVAGTACRPDSVVPSLEGVDSMLMKLGIQIGKNEADFKKAFGKLHEEFLSWQNEVNGGIQGFKKQIDAVLKQLHSASVDSFDNIKVADPILFHTSYKGITTKNRVNTIKDFISAIMHANEDISANCGGMLNYFLAISTAESDDQFDKILAEIVDEIESNTDKHSNPFTPGSWEFSKTVKKDKVAIKIESVYYPTGQGIMFNFNLPESSIRDKLYLDNNAIEITDTKLTSFDKTPLVFERILKSDIETILSTMGEYLNSMEHYLRYMPKLYQTMPRFSWLLYLAAQTAGFGYFKIIFKLYRDIVAATISFSEAVVS